MPVGVPVRFGYPAAKWSQGFTAETKQKIKFISIYAGLLIY